MHLRPVSRQEGRNVGEDEREEGDDLLGACDPLAWKAPLLSGLCQWLERSKKNVWSYAPLLRPSLPLLFPHTPSNVREA